MTFEPFEILDQALYDLQSQSQHMTEMIARLRIHNTPHGDRRSLSGDRSSDRRQSERRTPERAEVGRRKRSDRRMSPVQRFEECRCELERISLRGIELYKLKQNLKG